MKFSSSLRCLAIALVLARSGIPSEAAVPASESGHTWQRWEHALTSTRPYESPYAHVILRVTYTGPAQRTLRTYGFWDGGNVFRIRCAFPAPGTWQWETECSDISNTGLHHQRGKVEVTPYRGAHALFRHGFLKVSANRRYLTFGDNTPFLWTGDTAWQSRVSRAADSPASDRLNMVDSRAVARPSRTDKKAAGSTRTPKGWRRSP